MSIIKLWPFKSKSAETWQLELPLECPKQPDRNLHRGGRSFYFFDFDDNVLFLTTALYLFNRHTGEEKETNSREFALIQTQIGKQPPWSDYEIKLCPKTGSFRRFREQSFSFWDRLKGQRQPLI